LPTHRPTTIDPQSTGEPATQAADGTRPDRCIDLVAEHGLARGLSAVLPFNHAERAFLDLLLEKGEIDATILTSDRPLQERIRAQPLLEWKALNVRRYKGLS